MRKAPSATGVTASSCGMDSSCCVLESPKDSSDTKTFSTATLLAGKQTGNDKTNIMISKKESQEIRPHRLGGKSVPKRATEKTAGWFLTMSLSFEMVMAILGPDCIVDVFWSF